MYSILDLFNIPQLFKLKITFVL